MTKKSKEELNTRQMPCRREVTSEKNYCDILYGWIQCNSERTTLHSRDRQISKKQVKFTNIEREMTDSNGNKIMDRRTISKYFNWLVENGFLIEDGDYYRLRLLEPEEANIIYYKTLSTLINVFQRHSVDIYQYLCGRFFGPAGRKPFFITISELKKFIGISVTTTANNSKVTSTLEILKRLQLLDYEYVWQEEETKWQIKIIVVRDRLPELNE